MGYIDNNLIMGEAVAYRARLHWIQYVKPVVLALTIITISGLVFNAADLRNTLSTQAAVITWVVILVICAAPIASAAINSKSAEFAVTNKRVILKIGFVQSKTAEMFLNKIESVGVDQTITGRILGFGTVVIRGTGGSLEPFHRMSDPLQFRRQIQEQIGRTFEPSSRSASSST